MTKECSKCLISKELSGFYKDKQKSNGCTSKCKSCMNSDVQIYQKTNKKKIADYQKRYQKKDKYKEYKKEYRKQYNAIHRSERAAQVKERRNSDINFKLTHALRRRLTSAIKRNQRTGSAVRDLGCSIEEFKVYLSLSFQPGMSWKNYGKWHIDHKMPLSKFDLTKRKELLKACHYTNLQPLWAIDNLKKGDRIK